MPPLNDPKNDDPKNDDPKNNLDKKLFVEIFGQSIELPYDQAKAMIAKRDEKSQALKDLASRVSKYEKDLESEKRRADALEAAKKGELAEAEEIFSRKHQEKIDKYRNVTVQSALIAALKSDERFVGGDDITEDVLNLLKSKFTFDVDDELKVKAGDKTVNEVVEDFLNNKPIYCKNKTTPPTFRNQNQNQNKNQETPTLLDANISGMAAALKKKFG